MVPKTHSKFVRSLYFWIGIIATVAYRIVIILTHVDPIWVKISWYIGTVGFVIYFIHRYQVSERRADLIKQNDLLTKVNSQTNLSDLDKESIKYIFNGLQSSKEKWNYIFIFISSALALLISLYLDLFTK